MHTCNKCFPRRRPRCPTDTTLPTPFVRLHIDFTFSSVLSLRNNTAALTIVDAGTSYPWVFPTTSKLSPLDIIHLLIDILRNQGKEIYSI